MLILFKPTTLFVLGAEDEAMRATETLLARARLPVAYAMKDGARVRQEDAHAANGVDGPHGDEAVLVECGGRIANQFQKVWTITHRSELPPDRFLLASTLGQVILLLASQGLLPEEWERRPIPVPGNGDPVFRGGRWIVPLRDGLGVCLPPSMVAAAALKHCPEQALRGEILGV